MTTSKRKQNSCVRHKSTPNRVRLLPFGMQQNAHFNGLPVVIDPRTRLLSYFRMDVAQSQLR